MMLSITGAAVVSATGAVLVVIGLGMYAVPLTVRAWDCLVNWYREATDPDGARALARKDRGKLMRESNDA